MIAKETNATNRSSKRAARDTCGRYADTKLGTKFVPHQLRQLGDYVTVLTIAERQLLEIREELDSENQHRFDRQRARKHELVDKQTVELGARRL